MAGMEFKVKSFRALSLFSFTLHLRTVNSFSESIETPYYMQSYS